MGKVSSGLHDRFTLTQLRGVAGFRLAVLAVLVGCGGSDEPAADGGSRQVTRLGTVPAGDADCPSGGLIFELGADLDHDGILDDDEVQGSQKVCHGTSATAAETLVALVEEPPGDQCPAGGQRIDAGTDANGDGVLGDDEVTATSYVCDGESASSLATRVSAVPEGDTDCPYGGVQFEMGIDDDGDGVLDDEEVDHSETVCHGGPGDPGLKALLAVTAEPAGENCPAGGHRIDSGLDTDSDGTLDADEVTATDYVCDGVEGAAGADAAPLLARTAAVEEGDGDCPYGGVLLEVGRDDDGSGTLDEAEVDVSEKTCNGGPGSDGEPGADALVNLTAEPAGEECDTGGYRIDAGLDTNANGALDGDEITATEYVCNGAEGAPGADATPLMTRTSVVDVGDGTCPNGGLLLQAGHDDDGSGALDDPEVDLSEKICNGAPGSAGQPGADALVTITPEPAGEECETGGQRIDAGLDTNANGALDGDEITATEYVCNGAEGAPGADATPLMTRTSVVDVGDGTCPYGGLLLQAGHDDDGSGALDDPEVDLSEKICNGAPGSEGDPGANALVAVTPEPAGEECAAGGFLIEAGVDTDGSGGLDSSEITSAEYVCNGVDASTSTALPPVVSGPAYSADPTPTWSWVTGGGGSGTFRYALDSAALAAGGTETTDTEYTPTSAISDGVHTLYVQEQDPVGAWSAAGGWTITVDTTPPAAPGTPSDDGDYTGSTSVTFTWEAADDPISRIASYNLEVGTRPDGNNVFADNVGDVLSADVTGGDADTLYARVQAVNRAGLVSPWSAASDGIAIDTTPPSVDAGPDKVSTSFSWPTATVTDASPFTIAWTQQSGPGTVTFDQPDDEDPLIMPDTDGPYLLRITATDIVGSSAFDEMAFAYDTTYPTVDVGPDLHTATQVTVDASTYDANALTWTWSQISGPGTLSFGTPDQEDTTIEADTDGVYLVRLTATDVVGHWESDDLFFEWDTSPPQVAGASPTDGATGVALEATVHVGFSEPVETASVTFTLADGGTVGGSIEWVGGGLGLVFTPDAPLAPETTYTGTIAAGVTDLVGNTATAGASWQFTTSATGLPLVAPVYASAGDWNDYLENDGTGPLDASATACDPTQEAGYAACLHGGEILAVPVAGLVACTDEAATDALGLFEWQCNDTTGSVRMVTTGLEPGLGLTDLLDFEALAWQPNSVTVTGTAAGLPFTTAATTWWSNPVDSANGGGSLAEAGTIYLVTKSPPAAIVLAAPSIGVVVAPSLTLSLAPTAGQSYIRADGVDFVWIEGAMNVSGSSVGVTLEDVSFSVLRNLHVTDADYGTSCGIRLEGSANNQLSWITAERNINRAIWLRDSPFNVVLDSTLTDNGEAIDLNNAPDTELRRLAATDNLWGVYVFASPRLIAADLELTTSSSSSSSDGVSIGSASDGAHLEHLVVTGFHRGVYLERGADHFVSDLQVTGNASHGLQFGSFPGVSDCIVRDVLAADNDGSGIKTYLSTSCLFHDIRAFGNGEDGLYIQGPDNVLVGVTSSGNAGSGLEAYEADRLHLVDLTLANNGLWGLHLRQSEDCRVVRMLAANNGYSGASYDDAEYVHAVSYALVHNGSWGHEVGGISWFSRTGGTGHLRYGGNTNGPCYGTGCTDTNYSSLTNDVDASSSVVGKVTTDDVTNADDTDGAASYPATPALFDWVGFDNTQRAWGLDGSAFPNADHRGRWTSGDGRIWDWSLRSTDDVLRAVLPMHLTGDAADVVTHWRKDGSTVSYLASATERLEDGVGNDDGLCESDEDCVYAPNHGAYQGHGELVSAGTFTDGDTLTGIVLYEYESNGR